VNKEGGVNMFSKLFGKKNFDELYPSLVTYIKAQDKQDELINNQEFLSIYNKNRTLIDTFLKELAKYYKPAEITGIINKYIIRLENDKLIKLLIQYLNCDDDVKMDKKFFIYYDSENDMLVKSEEELNKEHMIDYTYNNLKKGTETFNGTRLDVLFSKLSPTEKNFINTLLSEKDGWLTFTSMFEERYQGNFKSLTRLFVRALIDGTIINSNVKNYLGEEDFMELVFTLLSNNNQEITKHVKSLIINNRLDLVKYLVTKQLIGDVVFINSMNNKEIDSEQLIKTIEGIKVKTQEIS
jgi:hypothetical protein